MKQNTKKLLNLALLLGSALGAGNALATNVANLPKGSVLVLNRNWEVPAYSTEMDKWSRGGAFGAGLGSTDYFCKLKFLKSRYTRVVPTGSRFLISQVFQKDRDIRVSLTLLDANARFYARAKCGFRVIRGRGAWIAETLGDVLGGAVRLPPSKILRADEK